MAAAPKTNIYTYEETLRRKPNTYPMNPEEYNQMCPEENITITVDMSLPLDLPPLMLTRTDTDGYYCMKRGAIHLLKEGLAAGLSLGESLQRQIQFFIERDGGTENYNDRAYISQYADEIIMSLLRAYEQLRG